MGLLVYKNESIKRLLVYLTIGGLAFLVEYASFLLLIHFLTTPLGLIIAQSFSFCFGLVISFTGNRLLTFNDSNSTYKHSVSRQIKAYALLALINLGLSNLAIYALVHHLSVTPLIAKLIVMSMVVLWNFLIFNRVIFKKEQSISL
jgi:putative flippase GtrA